MFGGRGRKKKLSDVKERELNPALRGKLLDKSTLSEGSKAKPDYLELLKVSTETRDVPFNRTKLFALGRAGSGKEDVLASLFNIDLREDTSGDMQPIKLGRYNSATFTRLNEVDRNCITMDVWNYSWKAVYNYLQNLYMTECALYLFVFDIKKVLNQDDNIRNETLAYLKNILHSKKLLAPESPVLLIGSNKNGLSENDIRECNTTIFMEVLQGHNFRVQLMTPGSHFGAVCCETGDGIELVKTRIHGILTHCAYVQEHVPEILLSAEEILEETGEEYMSYRGVRQVLRRIDVRDDDVCEILLKVLADRGMITFLHRYEALRKFIVINPDWLINACGIAIYKDGKHKPLDFDIDNQTITNDFNVFVYQRVLSRALLTHVLERMNYPAEVHSYIINLMTSTCMIANYEFDRVDSYLTPTFFDNLKNRTYDRKDVINIDDYQGPYFVLDFSGNHTGEIVADGGAIYCSYLPFSFFEKLVSLSIQLSASFGQGIQPITSYKKARLSFGAEVDFMLSVVAEQDGRPLKIRVSTLTDTPQDKANDLLERIFSMARGIRKDFYKGVENRSKLSLSLLVPPMNNAMNKLTNYEEILKAKSANNDNVIPNFRMPGALPITEFDRWFRDGQALQVGSKISFTPKQADGNFPLAEGKSHHCFLSYKETSALKVVQRQLSDLRALGYTCWLNKEHKGDLTLEVYLENVRKSMCFILVLSENVFESTIIVDELKTAIRHNVPIIFLHHPDTDKLGYWTFSQYISSCPADLRHLFEEIESIPLQKRFYLQEAVTNRLTARIRTIMG